MTNPIDIAQVLALTSAGLSRLEIAQMLGCSIASVARIRRQAGVTAPTSPPVDIEQVAMLTRAGRSAAQIADQLKCSKRTVERARTAAGVAQPPTHMAYLTVEEIDQVLELLADGCCLREASRTIGRHPDALYKNKRFAGFRWSRHEAAKFAGFCSRMSNAGWFTPLTESL